MSEDDFVKHEGKWTRADLPSSSEVRETMPADLRPDTIPSDFGAALDKLVDHLNEYHPRLDSPAEWLERELNNPDEQRQKMIAMDEARIEANIQRNRAIRERDEWKARADQLEKKLAKVMSDYQDVEDERDELKKHLKVTEEVLDIERKQHEETSDNLVQANQRWLAAIVERDEWKARADQLRDERDDAVQSCMVVGRERDKARKALEDERIVNESMTTSLFEVSRQRDDAVIERDAAVVRAEHAEKGAWRVRYQHAVAELLDAGRARDEWKARAEALEADRENIAEEFADFRAEVVAEAVKYRESKPPSV